MLKEASLYESKEAASLALLLWPEHTLEELMEEMTYFISQPDVKIFLAYHDHEPIGFANVSRDMIMLRGRVQVLSAI